MGGLQPVWSVSVVYRDVAGAGKESSLKTREPNIFFIFFSNHVWNKVGVGVAFEFWWVLTGSSLSVWSK